MDYGNRIKVKLTKGSPYSEYGFYQADDIGYIDGYIHGCAVIILENGKFAKAELDWIEVINEENNEYKSAEWKEEDNRDIKWCIEWLESSKMINNAPLDVENIKEQISWLKSLRPQNRWKPSEQDILLLERVIQGKSDPKDFQASLTCLLSNLKKLTE